MTFTINKKWFDLILSGEKKEEYREIKPFYNSRLKLFLNKKNIKIRLKNGYKKDSPYIDILCSISLGTGRTAWGAEPKKLYYVLKIKKILQKNTTKISNKNTLNIH